MKKILLISFTFCVAGITYAQTCPGIQGLSPEPMRYGINVFGQPETVFPTVPLYWNRFYKVDEVTGQIVPTSCSYTGDPNIHELAVCACYLTGIYFRSVTDVCDPTPCGGDLSLSQLPITNNNSSGTNWSQPVTWLANQVPDMTSSLSIMITKSAQVDVDLNLPANHWLIFTAGNSSVLAGNTITCNSIIKIYPAAQLENFGTLKGSGQIIGSLINSGTLSPGNSPGKFTVVGNYTATATAIHQVEIAALNSYDTIHISRDSTFPGGNAVLNGTLNVALLNGFAPSVGETYKIIDFTAATGVFSNMYLPALSAGLLWVTHYNANDITLEVTAAALPVTITYTKLYRKDAGVSVEWGTATEVNVKNYEIERSSDGIHFNKAGSVNSFGTGAANYSWYDATPVNGDNYYRIKSVDIDGLFMYSTIVSIKITGDNKITVYPNPVRGGEALQLNLQNITATKIEILNALGQSLYSKSGRLTGNVQVAVSTAWAAGQYVLRITSENIVVMKKILIR